LSKSWKKKLNQKTNRSRRALFEKREKEKFKSGGGRKGRSSADGLTTEALAIERLREGARGLRVVGEAGQLRDKRDSELKQKYTDSGMGVVDRHA